MYQKIDEQIDVVAIVEGNKLRPVRFRWQGRTYRLTEITGIWQTRAGQLVTRHFNAIDPNANYVQITFDPAANTWALQRIWND